MVVFVALVRSEGATDSLGIQGGGGGQPFFATAGGKDASGLQRAVEKARKVVGEV